MTESSTASIRWNSGQCDFCGACVGVCTSDAIVLFEAERVVDQERCTVCQDCLKVCPLGALEYVAAQ